VRWRWVCLAARGADHLTFIGLFISLRIVQDIDLVDWAIIWVFVFEYEYLYVGIKQRHADRLWQFLHCPTPASIGSTTAVAPPALWDEVSAHCCSYVPISQCHPCSYFTEVVEGLQWVCGARRTTAPNHVRLRRSSKFDSSSVSRKRWSINYRTLPHRHCGFYRRRPNHVWSIAVSWLCNRGKPSLDHGMDTVVEPWYHGRFYRKTPILVNLNTSPEVDEWLSKIGSKINNHLSTYTSLLY